MEKKIDQLNAYGKARYCIDRLVSLEIISNKTIIDILAYDDISLWWNIQNKFLGHLVSLIENSFNQNRKAVTAEMRYTLLRPVLRDLKVFLSKAAVKLSKSKHRIQEGSHKVLFFTDDSNWKKLRGHDSLGRSKADVFYDPIVRNLESGVNTVAVYPTSISLNGLNVLYNRLYNWHIPFKPFHFYMGTKARKSELRARKHFIQIWRQISGEKCLEKFKWVEQQGISYASFVNLLEYFVCIYFPYCVRCIESAKNMIDYENPDVIVLAKESSTFEQSIIIAAKTKGIPTLAIQHGNLTKGDFINYFHHAGARIVLPDITCVYGKRTVDLLSQKMYKPWEVVVTGSHKLDFLARANEVYEKDRIVAKYGIKKGKKIILWTTQSHGLSEIENQKNLTAVCKSIKNMRDVCLVIKQHPDENKEHRKLISECLLYHNIDAVLPDSKADTYELLFACDVLIAKYSTTAIEAIAIDKPVVILNLSGQPDLIDVVDQRVAMGVYREDDLQPVLTSILKDDMLLKSNRAKYIENCLHRIDGKASERIAQSIMNCVLQLGKNKRNRNTEGISPDNLHKTEEHRGVS